jgi:hypothetical protein
VAIPIPLVVFVTEVDVAAVDSVVAEDVVVLAEDTHPTVVVTVQGPRRSAIFPILLPTSSVKNTLIRPT